MLRSITHVACLPGPATLHIHHLCPYRYVVALKVPKFSGYKPGIFYDTAEPQHTAMLVPGKQSGRDGYFDMLLVAGEAHDQVSALLLCWVRDDSEVKVVCKHFISDTDMKIQLTLADNPREFIHRSS